MEIQVRTKCKDCDGHGIKENDIYTEFYSWMALQQQDEFADDPTQEDQDKWLFENYELGQWPPEEVECFECSGTGKVVSWIPFEKLTLKIVHNEL